MFAQLKYSSRIVLEQRIIAVAATVLINLVFYALGALGLLPNAWMIAGAVFSGLCMTALLVVNILADGEAIKSLFAAPGGYTTLLTPVPGWKVILGRALSMTALDIVSFAIGILGVILQGLLLSAEHQSYGKGDPAHIITGVITGLIGYITLLLLITFACALSKSYLFALPARGLLGFLATCVIIYLASFLDLLLAPFVEITRYGALISVHVTSGWNPGMIAFMALMLLKAAALLIATSYLYERKVNL